MPENDVIIVDNFFHKNQFLKLKEIVNSNMQDWYLRLNISIDNEGDPKTYYGFSCNIVLEEKPEVYTDTISSNLIFALNEAIKFKFGFNEVARCRLDMTTYRGKEQVTFGPHVDLDGEHYTSVYYITECNAPTIIYNEKSLESNVSPDLNLTVKETIYPKENRLVLFQGNHIHTGMCATDVSHRIIINSNFK